MRVRVARILPCIGVRPAVRLSAPARKTRHFPFALRGAARSIWDVGSRADTTFPATRPRTQAPRTETTGEGRRPEHPEEPASPVAQARRPQHTTTARASATPRLVDGR